MQQHLPATPVMTPNPSCPQNCPHLLPVNGQSHLSLGTALCKESVIPIATQAKSTASIGINRELGKGRSDFEYTIKGRKECMPPNHVLPGLRMKATGKRAWKRRKSLHEITNATREKLPNRNNRLRKDKMTTNLFQFVIRSGLATETM